MPDRVERRFTIADGMILVAAVWVASMAIRDTLQWRDFSETSAFADRFVRWAHHWIYVLGALSTAVLICRLRRPRPPRRRLWLLPGTTPALATAVVSLEFLAQAVKSSLAARRSLEPLPSHIYGRGLSSMVLFEFESRYLSILEQVAFCVGLTWLVLFLGGRWRGEPSWVDRLGRALGVCWIGLFLFLRWRGRSSFSVEPDRRGVPVGRRFVGWALPTDLDART